MNSQNAMSPQERAQYLPVMQALLNVMETPRPSPQDINTLMVLTRDLARQSGGASSELFGQFGGFGLDGLESMGLPEYGDIIVPVGGVPHIKTKWGKICTYKIKKRNISKNISSIHLKKS